MTVPEPSVVLVPGPWRHRDVHANGVRLHVAELGSGPLVVLLHGFPEFWWSWRHQLVALADQGFRAVAVDLRGYGASDKPPRGYDPVTLSGDVAGLVRALGEARASVVGHDWGALLGWTLAALRPDVVARLVTVGLPHPLSLRSALLRPRSPQGRASRYIAEFQLPWRPERDLVADDAARVGRILRHWGGPGFPDIETDLRCREAMQLPGAAHSALEYYRWVVRAQTRPDGQRWARALARPVDLPVLAVAGGQDRCALPDTGAHDDRFVSPGRYRRVLLPAVGHFPHQEDPATVSSTLLGFLAA